MSVELEPFTVFVGANGSGKSNFFDALAFVQECLTRDPQEAIYSRGAHHGMAHRTKAANYADEDKGEIIGNDDSVPVPDVQSVGLRFVLELDDESLADYAFEISLPELSHFTITGERCVVRSRDGKEDRFHLKDGNLVHPIEGIRPDIQRDRLVLSAASAVQPYASVYRSLRSIMVHDIKPEAIATPQHVDPGYVLKTEGDNAAAVLERLLEAHAGNTPGFNAIEHYLNRIIPGFVGVEPVRQPTQMNLWFKQKFRDDEVHNFRARYMSDGALRALGILLAIYQPGPLLAVGIEEPELTVHPAALAVLLEALMDASRKKQIMITTHSPELIDQKEIDTSALRLVEWHEGRTYIGPLSERDRSTIKDRLSTPGELLTAGELELDPESLRAETDAVDLFGEPFAGIDITQ